MRMTAKNPMARLAIAWCTLFVVGTDLFVISPLLPLLGRIADRISRRLMLSWCLVGFAVANLLTAMAPSFGLLLVARIVAGATAAGVSPSIYALVGESAPPARRASWMATAVSGLLCSLSFGAPLGALIGASFGWDKIGRAS